MKTSSQADSLVELGGNNACLFLSHWLKQVERGETLTYRWKGGELCFFFLRQVAFIDLRDSTRKPREANMHPTLADSDYMFYSQRFGSGLALSNKNWYRTDT